MKKCLEENAMLEMELNSLNDSQNRPKLRSLASVSSLNGPVVNGRPLSEELQQSFSITEIELENRDLKKKIDRLESDLREERQEKAKFEVMALKKLQEEVAKAKSNTRQQIEGKCKDEVDSLKNVKTSLEKDLESMQKELIVIETQRQSIESQKSEIKRLTESNVELQVEYESLKKAMNSLTKKNNSFESNKENLNENTPEFIEEIKNENLNLKAKIKSLEINLSNKKEHFLKDKEDFERKALTKLQQEIASAKTSVRRQLEKENTQEKDTLKSAKMKLYSDLENLQKEYIDIQQKNDHLEIEKCQIIKEKEELKRQLEMFKNQDMFARSASTPLQRSSSFREEPQKTRDCQNLSTNCTPLVSRRKDFTVYSEPSKKTEPILRQKARGIVNPVRRTLPFESHNASFRNTMPARSSVHDTNYSKPQDLSIEKISIKITITETITKIIHSRMPWNEKLEIIVMKLQDFQKKNDLLHQNLDDLKKDLSVFRERYEELRKCNYDLETENKRLSKIIEANHGSRPLHDRRTYQFYTAI